MHNSLECIKQEKFELIQAEKPCVQFLNNKLDQLIYISYFNFFELFTEPFVAFESVHQCGQHAVTQMAEPSRFSYLKK